MLEWEKHNMTELEWKALPRGKRWRLRHPEKQAAAMAQWVKNNPEKRRQINRDWNLKNQYGIDQKEYDDMLLAQKGTCAICNTATPTGKWKVFAVDHCHDTGIVRGLLCNECNRGMGLLGDDSNRLRKAADYLDKERKK